MTKVITYGTYDLLHYGHIRLLERAKELGDYLIVGVTADDFDKTRGKINVQQSLMERIEAVRATGLAEMSNKGQDKGVVVNNVKAGTPAAQIGLKKGDVIVGANQQPVKNIADLRKIFDAKPSVLALNIQRGDASIYLLLQ